MGMRASRRPRGARGIILLEVLISVLVLAFGVLGIIGLQSVLDVERVAIGGTRTQR